MWMILSIVSGIRWWCWLFFTPTNEAPSFPNRLISPNLSHMLTPDWPSWPVSVLTWAGRTCFGPCWRRASSCDRPHSSCSSSSHSEPTGINSAEDRERVYSNNCGEHMITEALKVSAPLWDNAFRLCNAAGVLSRLKLINLGIHGTDGT